MKQRLPPSLAGHRLVICLGSGGVGKTTFSAALAVSRALEGLAVDVMTIDPAPRLLDALQLDASDSAPRAVPLDALARGTHLDSRSARGSLRALRLDPKHTFDVLVARYAPSEAAREAILSNRIYHNLSGALAGVADYMAMERLLELYTTAATDLIVLDTPPVREALDFLDAPRRLLELVNSRAVTLLGASRGFMRSPLHVVDLAARAVLAAFDRLTGLHLLTDVQTFVRNFDGMYAGFAERAAQAQALLRHEATCLVLVTTAETGRVAEASEFIRALGNAGLRPRAVVVNRVMPPMPEAAELADARIARTLRRKLVRNLEDFQKLKRREIVSLETLRDILPAGAVLLVAPDLGREPRSLADLAEIGRSLKVA